MESALFSGWLLCAFNVPLLESTYCQARSALVESAKIRCDDSGGRKGEEKKRLTRRICSWKNTADIFGIDLAAGDNGGHSYWPVSQARSISIPLCCT